VNWYASLARMTTARLTGRCLLASSNSSGKAATTRTYSHSCVLVCKLSQVNSAAVIKKIKADGWVLVHTVGSHHQFKHPSKPGKVTVPHPKKDLPMPTVRSIFKQAGL
jgi:predicted RNA binding protein YcfA (HicA-like mRNA interferase family)